MIFETGFETMRAVAENSSFTKAAQQLGVTGPAVSKQIKQLEERLSLTLFHRTTRSVTLTESGKQLFSALEKSNEELSSLIELLAEDRQRPFGKLKINAPMSFGEKFLAEPIAEFGKIYPDVTLEVEFDDKKVHLIEEGYDLVIRIGSLESSTLIAKKLCDFSATICASPDFIDFYGMPANPNELQKLPAVIYTNSGTALEYESPEGVRGSITSRPAIYANSIEMLTEATLKGIGYVRLPDFFNSKYLNNGSLVPLLPTFKLLPERGIYAIYPDKRYLPLKVRKFIDHLATSMNNVDDLQ